jgi:hypothetical protein
MRIEIRTQREPSGYDTKIIDAKKSVRIMNATDTQESESWFQNIQCPKGFFISRVSIMDAHNVLVWFDKVSA